MSKPILIEDYNSDWSSEFDREKENLLKIFGSKVISIEHIGSTSVTGLGAKPIIDIMGGVNNLEDVDEFIEPLKSIGYEFVSHKDFPKRRFFRKGQWRAGTHHLHFYQFESEDWYNNILFRNFLRTHPDALNQYHQLKKELADKYRDDRVAYTKEKAPFIQNLIKKAKQSK